MMKKTIALALAAIMCLGVFTGCSKKDEEVSYWDTYKSTFSEGLATLNPYTLGGTSDYGFVANILDGLVEADHYGRYVPALAESWEANDDFTVWTFHLRKGQYWIDSTGAKTEWEITSQNFVDSMRYIADPANGVNNFSTIRGVIAGLYDYYYLLADIDDGIVTDKKREDVVAAFGELVGVKAVDDYTLEYTLDGPVPYFLSYTDIELMLPLEQRFLDKVGEDFGTSKENMLYCGGYYISTWDRDKLLILTKNENNWDKDNLTLKALSFEAVGDGISGVELFKRGQIATTKLSSEELSSVKSSDYGDYVYLSEKTLSTYWFTWNFKSRNTEFASAVQNLNFRKALYTAIDAVTLSAIWEPNDPAFFTRYTMLPENCMPDGAGRDYTDYGKLPEYRDNAPFDAKKAKSYIDAAISELCDPSGNIKGATPGKVDMLPITEFESDGKLPIDIVYSSGASEAEMKKSVLVKEMLESYLGKENVNIILGYANNDFNDEVYALENWDMLDDSYGFRYPDPSANLSRCTSDGVLNDSQYEVPEYDALIEKAMNIFDIEKRFAAFAEAEAYMLDNAIIKPYMTGGGSYRMTRIVPYTTPQSAFGMSGYKYKGAKVQDTPISSKQHKELKEAYDKELAALNSK